MRDYVRDWMGSFVSFARGHGGGSSANASVGAAFVIGALLVAVLGLRWVGAEGGTKPGTEETPWEFADAANVDTSTTIPASTPAKVIPIPDPDLADAAGDTTTTTRPSQTIGVFLPGYSPTPGGGVGPSTTIRPTVPPRPVTTRPGTTTDPPVTTTDPPVTTTDPPVTTTDPPVTTTDPPVTTTDPPTTTLPPEGTDLSDLAQDEISRQFAALGWPFS